MTMTVISLRQLGAWAAAAGLCCIVLTGTPTTAQETVTVQSLIDRQLILGGLIFGAGWGLVGYCPGPAIAGLAFGTWQSALFCIAMLAGMGLQRLSNGPRTHRPRSAA